MRNNDALIMNDGIYLHVDVINEMFEDALDTLNENPTDKNIYACEMFKALQSDFNTSTTRVGSKRNRWFKRKG